MKIKKQASKNLGKGFIYLLLAIISFSAGTVFAQTTGGGDDLGAIATNITGSFAGIATLMIAVSYIAGIGFVLAAIFKFKQHKDNPTQIPLGTPLAMLVIGMVLVFLPSIFGPAGQTIFGTGGQTAGGIGGEGLSKIPGGKAGGGGGS